MSDANRDLIATWRLLSELLVSPQDREASRIEALRAEVNEEHNGITYGIDLFLQNPDCASESEYVQTIELSPPCPLYLGSHLFDEPSTCNGIGSSARNPYMLELSGIYEHFGLDLGGAELPDYLPLMLDFLAISLEDADRDRIGLRRRFLEHYFLPGLEALEQGLTKYESPYVVLIPPMQAAAVEDLSRMQDTPAWRPADEDASAVSLPVVGETQEATP